MLKMIVLSSFLLACSAFAGEEVRLRANWELLQKHKIDLLPIPKFLELKPARPVERLVLSGLPEAKYRAAIIEELESRLSELDSPIKLELADKPVPGAFNLILEAWNEKSAEAGKIPFNEDSRFEQAYTLTPVPNGVILRGKGELGLLYAAVTMRTLIVRGENGALLYPAAVSDWPDFVLRRVGMRYNMFGQPRTSDPEQCLAIMQQVVKWALRRKINAFADMPYAPYSPEFIRLNAKPPYYDAKATAVMKQVTDYALSNGILAGRINGSIGVANLSFEEDAADPRFKGLVMYSKRLATWAHLDWHREINLRHAEFIKASGFAFANHHGVDSGGANDPELWSRRDSATRELYGDDRVKASLALWKTVRECFQGTGVKLSISQYPYTGCYLTNDGIRQTLQLADTPATREVAATISRRNIGYLKQLDNGLPKDIMFTLREGTTAEMKTFYDAVPQRPIKIYWEAANSNRDIVPLMCPEISMVKSSFMTPRKGELTIWLSDDYEFFEQNKALFAEFSWNRNFPGNREFSREDSPVGYPADFLRTLASRAAEGLWGMTYGPKLTALFDDLNSLAYAYDPVGFSKQRIRTKIDEPAYLKRNREALLRAEKAADAVFAEVASSPEKQQLLSAGSYPYFADMLRMLKGAKLYMTVNQAVFELENLAKSGKMKECEDFYAKATSQLKAMGQEYRRSMAALEQAPTRTDFKVFGKWLLQTSVSRFVNLLSPDMAVLQKQLDDVYEKRQALFTLHNVPDWYRQYNRYYFFKCLSAGPQDCTWKHFFGHKIFNLAPNPVELRLRRTKDGLVFSGTIIQPNPEAYSGKAVTFREWPNGDSAGIHLLPSDSATALQVVVGSSGGAFVSRRTTSESGISTSATCDLNLNPDVKRTSDGWEFSLEIPFRVLNSEPGKGWKALFEYNENNTPYASAFADGKSFNDPSFWQTLVFGTQSPWHADILLNSGEITMADQAHATGSGTLVTFQPRLETTAPVFVKSFTAIIRDSNGKVLSKPLKLMENRFIPLCWTPDAPFGVQLDVSHPGIAMELAAVYREDGIEKQTVRTLFAGKIEVKGEPLPDGTPTMRSPFIRSEKLTHKQGSLSFTFQPDWHFSRFSPPVNKFLFHAGPQLKPGKFNWKSAMLIRYLPTFQRFYFSITNSVRNTLIVSAKPENWDGKSPLEIAVSWDMTGEKPQMALFFNGVKAADNPKTWDDKELQVRFVPDELPYSLSFGALNSGDDPADGTIGKVKIEAQKN